VRSVAASLAPKNPVPWPFHHSRDNSPETFVFFQGSAPPITALHQHCRRTHVELFDQGRNLRLNVLTSDHNNRISPVIRHDAGIPHNHSVRSNVPSLGLKSSCSRQATRNPTIHGSTGSQTANCYSGNRWRLSIRESVHWWHPRPLFSLLRAWIRDRFNQGLENVPGRHKLQQMHHWLR